MAAGLCSCGCSSCSTQKVVEKRQQLQNVVFMLQKQYRFGMYNCIRVKRHSTQTDNATRIADFGFLFYCKERKVNEDLQHCVQDLRNEIKVLTATINGDENFLLQYFFLFKRDTPVSGDSTTFGSMKYIYQTLVTHECYLTAQHFYRAVNLRLGYNT